MCTSCMSEGRLRWRSVQVPCWLSRSALIAGLQRWFTLGRYHEGLFVQTLSGSNCQLSLQILKPDYLGHSVPTNKKVCR